MPNPVRHIQIDGRIYHLFPLDWFPWCFASSIQINTWSCSGLVLDMFPGTAKYPQPVSARRYERQTCGDPASRMGAPHFLWATAMQGYRVSSASHNAPGAV
jgi:hypothetical protein